MLTYAALIRAIRNKKTEEQLSFLLSKGFNQEQAQDLLENYEISKPVFKSKGEEGPFSESDAFQKILTQAQSRMGTRHV